jgi:hypothetical protein
VSAREKDEGEYGGRAFPPVLTSNLVTATLPGQAPLDAPPFRAQALRAVHLAVGGVTYKALGPETKRPWKATRLFKRAENGPG